METEEPAVPEPGDLPSPRVAEVQVRLDRDGLEAWACTQGDVPSADEVRAALAQHRIMAGLDEAAIARLSEAPSPQWVLVAQGREAVPGADGRIDVFFPTGDLSGALEDAEGRIDIREVRMIPAVSEGQELARRVAPTEGEPGMKVTGEPIPATAGKDVALKPGKNVVVSADRGALVAKRAGLPELDRDGRIHVQPVLVVDGVDFATGNLTFEGSIQVKGDVQPGFSVKATESIEIMGCVEAATIVAGTQIRIQGSARSHSVLEAGRDVDVRYADSGTTIKAKGNVVIKDSALHCEIAAGHNVIVGKNLIGGKVSARETISTQNLGTHSETQTHLVISQQEAEKEIEKLQAEVQALEARVEEIGQAIHEALAHGGSAASSIIQRLTAEKVKIGMQLVQLRAELPAAGPKSFAPARVVVKGELFPGTLIQIDRQIIRISEVAHSKTIRVGTTGRIELV